MPHNTHMTKAPKSRPNVTPSVFYCFFYCFCYCFFLLFFLFFFYSWFRHISASSATSDMCACGESQINNTRMMAVLRAVSFRQDLEGDKRRVSDSMAARGRRGRKWRGRGKECLKMIDSIDPWVSHSLIKYLALGERLHERR